MQPARTNFFQAIITLLLLSVLAACSAADPEPPLKQPDLVGFTDDLNQDAQKLYATARVLWDADEKCSEPERAIEYLDVVIELEPEYADAYIRRALAASELGEWDEAFNDSSRAIRLASKPDHYAMRSLIFMREGNYKGARKDLERALKLDPKNIRAREYLQDLNKLEAANL